MFTGGRIKNAFIFGEDPVGCAIDKNDVKQWFKRTGFVVVQDFILTETAQKADLVLPASFPWESGGSFTNSQRKVVEIKKQLDPPAAMTGFDQLSALLSRFDQNGLHTPADAFAEAVAMKPRRGEFKDLHFVYKEKDNYNRLFEHGCDALNRIVDEEFADKLGWR
jgi:predicted molibdopterin-dependent oxidoreductase YjgC